MQTPTSVAKNFPKSNLVIDILIQMLYTKNIGNADYHFGGDKHSSNKMILGIDI